MCNLYVLHWLLQSTCTHVFVCEKIFKKNTSILCPPLEYSKAGYCHWVGLNVHATFCININIFIRWRPDRLHALLWKQHHHLKTCNMYAHFMVKTEFYEARQLYTTKCYNSPTIAYKSGSEKSDSWGCKTQRLSDTASSLLYWYTELPRYVCFEPDVM